MKELEEEIRQILIKCYGWTLQECAEKAAKEITSLYNKELAFEIACNPDVMEAETNNKMYQDLIDELESKLQLFEDKNMKQAKLIEAQDKLIDLNNNKNDIIPERYSKLRDKYELKIAELRKEEEK